MIFERRVYRMKLRRAADFWAAQERWNTPDIFAPILDGNLFYASRPAGGGTVIVHLYRFADLGEWYDTYANYYRRQSPDYFATVRQWMTRQDSAFFRDPANGVAGLLAQADVDGIALPAAVRNGARNRIVETMIDLVPGSLPGFLDALASGYIADDGQQLGTLVTLVGRQHRVVRYQACASRSDAAGAVQRMRAQWYEQQQRLGIARVACVALTPSPLASRRKIFA